MKNKTLYLIFFCLLTIACSPVSAPPSTPANSQETANKVAVLPDKAEKVCGDRLPEDPASYPVNFYSVSVEYSADNLAKIKNHFCEDALPKTSESLGREVVQVASFISKEKADSFKVKLSQYFGQVTIGEPTIIEKSKNKVDSRKSLSQLSGLKREQFNQINNLRKESRTDSQNRKFVFRPILPTYIPEGFKVEKFEVISRPGIIHREGWQGYTIIYASKNSQCFSIAVDISRSGGPPEQHEEVKVMSQALGEVTLAYTDFDKGYNTSYITLNLLPISLRHKITKYFFTSPNMDLGQYPYINLGQYSCNRISLKDAISIVENLVFLEDSNEEN